MRKRLTRLFLALFLLASVIPISASAWGGYVSASGQKTYHIIYCEELLEYPYNQLRWYDTQKQAENSGLLPCEICEAADWSDFEELDGSFFETNDRLLDAAFDAAIDYGHVTGYASGYETGWADAECDMEYRDNGYSSYDSYTPDEIDEAYDEGYDRGYDAGYTKGVEDGLARREESTTSWTIYAFGAFVLYVIFKIGVYVGEDRSSKTIGELHTKNMELHRILNRQKDAVYMLELIAKRGNLTMEDIADSLYVNYHKSMGYSDADARALLNQKKQEYKQNKS